MSRPWVGVVELLGAPFVRGGRTKDGMDCLGAVLAGLAVLRPDLEVQDPWRELQEEWEAGVRPGPDSTVPDGWELLTPPVYAYQPGDVLFLLAEGGPNHLGLYLGDNLVLHATANAGTILSPLGRLRKRVSRALRPPRQEGGLC